MKSLDIILTGKQKIELVEKDVPDPLEGEIVGRTLLSLISTGTEMTCYRGEFDPGSHWERWVKYPFYIGYQNIAEAVKVGPGVKGVKEGDVFFSSPGAHRQAFIVKEEHIIKLPASLAYEDAGWASLATTTQTGVRRGRLRMGMSVVVIGMGPLGQLVTQYARVMGCEEIIAIDMVQKRLDMARTSGATQTFKGGAGDALQFVKDCTHGRLADVVFDVTGNWAVLPLALPLARQWGKLVLVGDTAYPSKQHLTPDVMRRGVDIVGSFVCSLPPEEAEWNIQRQAQLYFTYVQRGQMNMRDLVTHRHSPAEAPKVYAGLLEKRDETMGVAFDWANFKK